MAERPYDHFQNVAPVPKVIGEKRKRPNIIAVVDEDNCTGCEACVPFCPVDCIEHVPEGKYDDVVISPVQIRFNECIGCQICVRVCDRMTWSAIQMHPTEEVEQRFDVEISGKKYGWEGVPDDPHIGRKTEQHVRK